MVLTSIKALIILFSFIGENVILGAINNNLNLRRVYINYLNIGYLNVYWFSGFSLKLLIFNCCIKLVLQVRVKNKIIAYR